MTISGLCVDIQIASANHNCWSIYTSITQSFASCKTPDLSNFFDDALHCSPFLTKVIMLSFGLVCHDLHLMHNYPQYCIMTKYASPTL